MNAFRLLFVLLLFAAMTIQAQEQTDTVSSLSGITIETSVDKAEVFIGDLVNYKVTVIYDSSIELLPPPLGANLGAFDVKDYETDITTELPDGKLKTESRFVLSTFTTGDYVIPPVPMAFVLPDGARKIVLSETVPIKVKSLLLNTDDSADIKPLKAQYEFQRDYTWYYIWGAVVLLFLGALGYFFWWRRRQRKEAEFVDLRPAWEIAFEKLAKLEQKRLIEESKFKEYYLDLTDIIRAFLGRMYAANITDMTTEELFAKYETIGLPEVSREPLDEFFGHADLVKFAKFVPEPPRCQSDFRFVHDQIEQVRLEFLRKAEVQLQVHSARRPGSPNSPLPPAPLETVKGENR
jgi:hypothetical protein